MHIRIGNITHSEQWYFVNCSKCFFLLINLLICVFNSARFTRKVPDSTHLFRLTVFEGVVTRVTKPCFQQRHVKFMCSRCKYQFDCEPLFEEFFRLRLPSACPRPSAHCNSTKFLHVSNDRANPLSDDSVPNGDVSNYCEVRVSEVDFSRTHNRLPRSIWVALEDDLVGACKPGDEVQVLYAFRM